MRVTKIIKTETAHRLYKYNGACANIHGHTYTFEVTLEAPKLDTLGMVVDFKEIKATIGDWLMKMFDHAIILHAADPLVETLADSDVRITAMDCNPTAENMAKLIMEHCRLLLDGCLLINVRVWETETSFADCCGDE